MSNRKTASRKKIKLGKAVQSRKSAIGWKIDSQWKVKKPLHGRASAYTTCFKLILLVKNTQPNLNNALPRNGSSCLLSCIHPPICAFLRNNHTYVPILALFPETVFHITILLAGRIIILQHNPAEGCSRRLAFNKHTQRFYFIYVIIVISVNPSGLIQLPASAVFQKRFSNYLLNY